MNIESINVEKKIKVIFMGTPDFCLPILEELIKHYNVRAIITQPDKKVGRDQVLTDTPAKIFGNQHNILVLQPVKVGEIANEIKEFEPDIIITCAYGQIIPKEILDIPKYGCINVHASLLPKLRGGAPIHWAIINGFTKTGITIMYMNEKMDAGDIIKQEEIEILETDTAGTLHDKLSLLGAKVLIEVLPSILNGTSARIKQDLSQVTYAFTIKREDERISFSKSKKEIYNLIRGLNPTPGAYCFFEGKILKIYNARITDKFLGNMFDGQISEIYEDGIGVKVSNGEIVLLTVQLEGKNKMSAVEFIHGRDKKELIGKVLD